jgi:hypothetical protein
MVLIHAFLLPTLFSLVSTYQTLLEPIDLSTTSIPTVRDAASQARRLVLTETISTLSTVFSSSAPHNLTGMPIGLMDYYADCSENGNPTLIGMSITTSFRNVAEGSFLSLSIRAQSSGPVFSPAALPRLALIGKLVRIPVGNTAEAERLKKCFTLRHPDAKIWTPGGVIHDSYWTRLDVEKVYLVGGFGNVAYIGWIPVEIYNDVKLPFREVQEVVAQQLEAEGEELERKSEEFVVQGGT